MKKLLIKLSRWINNNYGIAPEIDDIVSFQGLEFRIVNTELVREIGHVDSIVITAYGGFERQLKR